MEGAELRFFSVKPPGLAQTPVNTRTFSAPCCSPALLYPSDEEHPTKLSFQAGKQRIVLLLAALPRAVPTLCAPHPLPGGKEAEHSQPWLAGSGAGVKCHPHQGHSKDAPAPSGFQRRREARQEGRKGKGRQINKDNAQFMKTRR